jgi:2'-5' RNA ligase
VPRAFLALTLDDETRSAVAAIIERLRPLSQAVAWVPEPNLHLTLKFLGNQSEARLAEVRDAVAEAVAASAPFTLTLHGVGAFPGMERPRILWVGVADGALAARELQGKVEAALVRRGFAADTRPWHPHLTIGRVFDDRRWRREAGPALREAVAEAARRSFGVLAVGRVVLMRSDLSPRGARYAELASAALGAPE